MKHFIEARGAPWHSANSLYDLSLFLNTECNSTVIDGTRYYPYELHHARRCTRDRLLNTRKPSTTPVAKQVKFDFQKVAQWRNKSIDNKPIVNNKIRVGQVVGFHSKAHKDRSIRYGEITHIGADTATIQTERGLVTRHLSNVVT